MQITTSDGLALSYHEIGSGTPVSGAPVSGTPVSGTPVVFLHGSGPGASGWSNFKDSATSLADHGFHTFVPDLIGFGASDKPADKAYTLDFFASGITDFLDQCQIDRCALIGNSLGGAIAIKLALDQPARFEKLILMAPGSLEKTETYMKMKGIRKMAATFMSPTPERESLQKLLLAMVHDPSFITDDLIEERFEIFCQQPKEVLSTMRVPNQVDRLKEIQCPVLAFWGMEDDLCPVSGADALMKECIDIRCILINHCGHWVMVEHKDLFNRMVVDFLQNG